MPPLDTTMLLPDVRDQQHRDPLAVGFDEEFGCVLSGLHAVLALALGLFCAHCLWLWRFKE